MSSSTGTLKSRFGGSVASLDSLRTTDPFSKSPRVNKKQLLAVDEDVVDGPSEYWFDLLDLILLVPCGT